LQVNEEPTPTNKETNKDDESEFFFFFEQTVWLNHNSSSVNVMVWTHGECNDFRFPFIDGESSGNA
jgi:hypothetical protein